MSETIGSLVACGVFDDPEAAVEELDPMMAPIGPLALAAIGLGAFGGGVAVGYGLAALID